MAQEALIAPNLPAIHDTTSSTSLFVVAFVVFLAIALVARMLTMQWRTWLPGAEGEKSMIGGVRAAVYTFMSHIP